MKFLRTRQREAEWMDEPNADAELLRKSLAFIRRINFLLGYTRWTIRRLDQFCANWPAGKTLRVLDVATGSADVPVAILKWADGRKLDVRVVGIDLSEKVARAAAEVARPDARLYIVRGDALHLPFADNSFDYSTTSMFLHHLSDAQTQSALVEMDRVASRGMIISDLIRRPLSYAFIRLFTLWANPMVKHDAPVSVAQAFTEKEITAIRDRAGLHYAEYFEHGTQRFMLAGEKEG